MTGQIRSELLKLRTRTTLWLFVGTTALTLLGVFAQGLMGQGPSENLRLDDNQRMLFATASTAGLFAALVGLLAVTTEFRYGTIRTTLLLEPRRRRMLAAKLVAATLAGLVGTVLIVGAGFGATAIVLFVHDVPLVTADGAVAGIGLGCLAGSVLWALLGVGVGILVRSQVGAILGLVAWLMIVESILFGVVPAVGKWLPGEAANALAGVTTDHLLSPLRGGAIMLAWTAALVIAGAVRSDRSDVP